MSSTSPQVRIDHTVIRRGEEGIDQYFIDYNLTKAFEEYKQISEGMV